MICKKKSQFQTIYLLNLSQNSVQNMNSAPTYDSLKCKTQQFNYLPNFLCDVSEVSCPQCKPSHIVL